MLSVLSTAALTTATMAQQQPEQVTFMSGDGRTTLVAYVFVPEARPARMPAVVMMHGRAGPYSSLAKGRYDASTISQRHRAWGTQWAANGMLAVLVDSFGPRGYGAGFPRFSYDSRPAEVNEVSVRPLDAYGALAWLRQRTDIAPDRIGLQGWSNGASATLVTMAAETLPPATKGFNAAVAFYPACGLRGRFDDGVRNYAPLRVFHGTADEEVSYARCRTLVERSRKFGSDIDITIYPGATHGFDDPGRTRQSNPANREATTDATARTLAFFAEHLQAR